MRRIVIPGWAVPLRYYDPFCADEILDFGFFRDDVESETSAQRIAAVGSSDFSWKPSGTSSPAVFIAHSLGTLTALRISHMSPRCGVFVLMGGFARFASAEGYPGGKAESGINMMLGMLNLASGTVLKKFHEGMYSPAEPPAWCACSKPDIRRLAAGLECLKAVDLRDTLKGIRNKTLVVHGDSDKIVSPELGEYLASHIPGAELHMIRGAGHALPFTHASECLELIGELTG